jgi:hypothetical protein
MQSLEIVLSTKCLLEKKKQLTDMNLVNNRVHSEALETKVCPKTFYQQTFGQHSEFRDSLVNQMSFG